MRTLRNRLLRYFLAIILLMASLNIAVIWLIRYHYGNVADFYSSMIETQAISLRMDEIFSNTENYLLSGNSEYIASYHRDMRQLQNRIATLKQRRPRNTPAYFALADMEKILQTFDQRREQLLQDYRARVERIYLFRSTLELGLLPQYVKNQADIILAQDLHALRVYFAGVGSNLATGERIVFFVIALVLLLCVYFSLRFSRHLSVPIQELVHNLQLFATGKLDLPPLGTSNTDEIAIMVHSFNDMTGRIKEFIERTKAQAETEALIRQQNLEMENALKQSELELLQAQINPHFLFNTLNTISALADLESAPKTKEVLDNMSHILRYNLKRGKEKVTLQEELETVSSYLQIQKTRFSRRLEYTLETDPDCLDVAIPGLVLQPFVENAVIHGLEPSVDVCHIRITAEQDLEHVLVTIRDDGVGIDPARIGEIVQATKFSSQAGWAPGQHFGISNVCRRFQLFYGRDVVNIESSPGVGTTVSIAIPRTGRPVSLHIPERNLA
ncbi:MAG: HAMP domain-containing protein [Spirochaetaceae bacterium]|nr:MAG: HAMP domain-containing protein [Spirochaetaceae bacterium]